ncbi:hypothetical protein BL02_116 [Klebsiella phage BL02]|jgi:hypothetical protein|uniref:Uncharacterized protein n=6 Tax=Viruses TaxID=10239 RepID=A0A6H0X233_9CAUD|nr:hypothetical protein KP15_101 [Klebsiella phage KP15]YP_007348753.1 hypothetical protein KP27_129 [Klebsiella phage KP27]YP_009194361.1 hypothetical protein CPT_Matisse117 [Klebsiella phage Matisse]MBG2194766.1 hypothetical protein [Klebsiella pneumoniae]QIW86215.1 hypothetical protein PKP2_163 [Klebsiella phage P-KP2]QQO91516.1 hypothetical protein vBKpnMM1_gp117c [Klebsiella phage vB_KpnM_M1]QWY13829.1 hypothetical protein [Klebsiella phage vB_KpnM_VAC13]URQ04369.1 hypothetical protein 
MEYEICVKMPPYQLGEEITFSQTLPVPIDLFSLRKYLERFDLNEYTIQIVRIKNPVAYALSFDVGESQTTTMDDFVSLLSSKFGCDDALDTISKKVNEILIKFTYK